MSKILTCGSNSCLLDKPKGQGTNGPCSCIPRTPTANKLRLQEYISRERAELKRLREFAKIQTEKQHHGNFEDKYALYCADLDRAE